MRRLSVGLAARAATLAFVVATLLSASACADAPSTTAPAAPRFDRATEGASTTLDPAVAAAVDSVARGLALALAAPEVRQSVRDDLRDSPFPQHRLHLPSYLSASRGRALASAIAAAAGMTVDRVLAVVGQRRGMQLWMPRSLDRSSWTGGDDVVVMGTSLTGAALLAESPARAYTTRAEVVRVNLLGPGPRPYLALMPAETAFGADPERVRAGALPRDRPTISSREEEFSPMIVEDTSVCCGSYDATSGVQLPSGRAVAQCLLSAPGGSSDLDNDRLIDSCEVEIAQAFRPSLRFDHAEPGAGREVYYSVAPFYNAVFYRWDVQVFYALGYYYDYGFSVGGDTHWGDSEFIIAYVGSSSSKWYLNRAKLSAHYQGIYDHTETDDWQNFSYDGPSRTRLIAYVAYGKHANYRVESECDDAAAYLERCDGPFQAASIDAGYPIGDAENLGNQWSAPGVLPRRDCVSSRQPGASYVLECYWNPPTYDGKTIFRGWSSLINAVTDASGGYDNSLRPHGF